ncbi:MAG: hypothetical protein Fur0014_05310 [Rubrivivax sp.]
MTTLAPTIAPTLSAIDRPPPANPAGRQALKDLVHSLQSGDLDGARQAWVQVVRHAPEGATWNPASGFAEIGRALKAGDIAAAQEAAKAAMAAWAERRPGTAPVPPAPPEPAAAPSTTGGAAGTLLNVVA